MDEKDKVVQPTVEEESDETEESEKVEVLSEEDVEGDIEQQLQEIKEEKDHLQDRLLRVQAEFDNFKRRTEKERIAERKYKSQDIITELLPVLDNFERALQTEVSEVNKGFVEGVEMVYNSLTDALKSQGVVAIDAVNQEFDPNMHHAVMQVEDPDFASNTVVEEVQKGFMLKDKVIRPAMVKVNK